MGPGRAVRWMLVGTHSPWRGHDAHVWPHSAALSHPRGLRSAAPGPPQGDVGHGLCTESLRAKAPVSLAPSLSVPASLSPPLSLCPCLCLPVPASVSLSPPLSLCPCLPRLSLSLPLFLCVITTVSITHSTQSLPTPGSWRIDFRRTPPKFRPSSPLPGVPRPQDLLSPALLKLWLVALPCCAVHLVGQDHL